MKIITLLLSILLSTTLMAQVAIGTDTPAVGAALTIQDSTGTSGVLFPKVDILDLSTVHPLPTGTEDGTIVYNTNSTTGEGYYYFKDGSWQPIFGTVGGMAKFRNQVSGSGTNDFNVNASGSNAQVFDTSPTPYFNDNNLVYHVVNNTTLRVREAGRYKIIINLSLEGTTTSATDRLLAVEGRLQVNGFEEGGIYRSGEMITNSSTSDFSSITISEIVNLAAMDDLTVRVSRTQDEGTVRLRSLNTSSFFIERLN